MTLQRANWLAQLMRKWGFSAIVRCDYRRNCWEVFAYTQGHGSTIYTYQQAVNFR